jgi:RNA polymerase sigma-70 factor (ECF subfamily)
MGEREEEQARIDQSQRGNPAAFEPLVIRYQKMIHSLTYRMTGSLSDAEDLAQETFIQAFRELKSFRADARFSSWLYRIAVNRCLNWRRRAERQDRVRQEWGEQETASDLPDHDLANLVQEALLRLPPKQRAAVVLTTYDGLSHAEAARMLGCAETTVSWLLFVARKKLRESLKGVGVKIGAPA